MVAKETKVANKEVAKVAKLVGGIKRAEVEEVAERAGEGKPRVAVRSGNRSRQARMHQHAATANFLACLFNPFDCPSRMPDKMQMLQTTLFPFRQTAIFTGTTGGSPNRVAFDVYPVLQSTVLIRTGTTTWGSTSISTPGTLMFSAASTLAGFILAARCVGLKVRIEYASPFTSAQGVVYAAILPPGYGGGAASSSFLSQLPNSATASVTTLSATGAFEMVWLPQRAATDYTATYVGVQNLQPYDPQAFLPFNGDTEGSASGMPFIQVVAEGMGNLAVFMVTVEACFECDTKCAAFIGSDERPGEEAFDVMDDLVPELFPKHVGVIPQTVASMRENVAPQQTIVQEAIAGAPASMSEPTAGFLDAAEGVLAKAGPKVWDMVKEYGPDALSSVVGLLPGGSIATTAAKIGGSLAKWLM